MCAPRQIANSWACRRAPSRRETNIWSKDDWISGKLDFYGPIENLEDEEACIPLIAHTQYWRNRLLFDKVFEKIAAPVTV